MHLVETAYQKEYVRRRGGGTALDYIDRPIRIYRVIGQQREDFRNSSLPRALTSQGHCP